MKYTLLFLFLIPALIAKDYSIIIDKPFNEALLDITQNYDRTLSAIGFSKEYKDASSQEISYTDPFQYLQSLSNTYGSHIAFIKIDKHVNILIDKKIQIHTFAKASSLVKTPRNAYFIGGSTLDGSLLVVKLDSNSNILFTKTFGTQNHNSMSKLIYLNDGGVLAIASSTTSRSEHNNIFETGLGLNDIYITRFSKNGKKRWSKKYGTQHDDRGIDAVEAKDGSIIVLGTSSYQNNKNIILMRISENGNKIWLKEFIEEDTITPYKIIKLRDNNFLLSLSKQNELYKEQIRLIKFDLQKNILIDKVIVTSYSSALKDIKEYSDGSLIGVGYVKDTYNTDALVMILDNTLSMLHQEHFGDENYDIFNGVTIMHNSQAAVVGLNTSPLSQESNMWITKINRDGTMLQVSTQIENFYVSLTKLFSKEIKNGIIKIKEDLTIEFPQNNLLFKVGEFQLNARQKIVIDKFSKKLIPFLYKNKKNIKALEINGHTSSEWGNLDFTSNYLKNEKLSMKRSFSTLSHLFKTQDIKTKKWLSQIIKGSGLGFSKKIIFDNTEHKRKSRRVSFKLIL